MKKYLKSGEVFIWLTGMGLGISLIMISGLLLLILVNGKDYFWASELVQIKPLTVKLSLEKLSRRKLFLT